jgi:glycine betaine/proline transport system substrate-binding protein
VNITEKHDNQINPRRNLVRMAVAAIIGFGLSGQAANAVEGIPENEGAIKIAVADNTGQLFQAYVLGQVLQSVGYEVEYVAAGYYPQVQGLADGDLHMTTSLWSSNMGEGWMNLFETGQVLDAGETHHAGVEAWYANDKALEVCPGLDKNWEVLNNCVEAFATAETFPQGRFLDYPIEWGDSNQKRIAALNLPFVSQPSGSEGALISEINAAEDREEPLIVQFWSPHGIFADVNLTPVPLPAYAEGCNTDPAVGVNPDATYDCDWAPARVWKGAWPGVETNYPLAYRILQNFEVTGPEMAQVMKAVDTLGGEIQEYVDVWVVDNKDHWQGWVDDALANR